MAHERREHYPRTSCLLSLLRTYSSCAGNCVVHSLNRSTHTQPQKKYLPRHYASAMHATCWWQA